MDNNNLHIIYKEQLPKRLLEIPDPPDKLYTKGVLPSEENKFLCVVGSRKHSDYGKSACIKLIEGLRGYPIVIVSGLAYGIDAIAHHTALDAGLKTIAFPGSGLNDDILYPRANFQLAKRIVAEGGALLSEFEPDFHAQPWTFPQRNRLMAGISDAVLVIESSIKSGTLITAKLATEYNRDVLTVPGSIFSSNSEGPHQLIRGGATPIRTSRDILDALHFNVESEFALPQQLDISGLNLSKEEFVIFDLLEQPMTKENIFATVSMPAYQVNSILSLLEIKGLIVYEDGYIRRA
jgi:DNA processing protein